MSSPLLVKVTGTLGGIAVNDSCTHVFVTNTTFNRVEVYSLETLTLETPIQVGSQPAGLDFTPDGSLLYVANSGGSNISVVDVAQRVELRKINVPASTSNDKPFSIAIANNGLALFSTTFPGSGFGGRMMQLVLETDAVSARTDFGTFGGATTQTTRLAASGDRGAIGIVIGSSSNGPVVRYVASTNTFSPQKSLGTTVSDVALDMTGSTLLVSPGSFILDAALNHVGTIPHGGINVLVGGITIDPVTGTGYRSMGSRVEALNLSSFLKIGDVALGDTVTTPQGFNALGDMDSSADGKLVAVITDQGFSLVRPSPFAQPSAELVANGSFSSGLGNWFTFATPDMSHIVASVVGGVLEYYRVPPPPGESNQAVVFQHTGMGLSGGSPIRATFDLGNGSSVRKRISVLVLDSDFTDLYVCTFWLKPNQPLTTYEMRTYTTEPWTNAAIYFYAATEGSSGDVYRIDNVSLKYEPALGTLRTDCLDPNAPAPAGGPDGTDLIVNGGFGTGVLTPWGVFGTLTSRISSGFFEFFRPNSTPPAGVVLQATGQAVPIDQILTATFQLGNSSAVRKRVTVIIHDNDFTDLSACTFWIPPFQFPMNYAMRSYTTRAWTNATISFYAATVGPEQWTRLDNVTLRQTPAGPASGTECVEPGATLAAEEGLARRPPVATHLAPARLGRAGEVDAPHVRLAPGAAASMFRLGDVVDFTTATTAHLRFDSWLEGTGAVGSVEISADGERWRTVLVVAPSADWEDIDVDLSDWIGQAVGVRFVLHGISHAPHDRWHLRKVRVETTGSGR